MNRAVRFAIDHVFRHRFSAWDVFWGIPAARAALESHWLLFAAILAGGFVVGLVGGALRDAYPTGSGS